jgi:G:T-mismatch repair DNA endonuclease (very short patch repair protein)
MKNFSKRSIKWLTAIEKQENIDIQHALKSAGEYKIPGVGKVDGYCQTTNTVYEFHGDFWHGNPNIYNHNDINPTNHKTYKELFNNTVKREMAIIKLGYKLITIWESDYVKDKKNKLTQPVKLINI